MKKILLFLIVVICACACQTKHRGYVFPENLETKLAGIKTTTQLQDEIGDPQVKTVHGDEVWIYYGSDETLRGPFPVDYNNKVVVLVWVQNNKIIQTKILHDDDLQNIQIAKGETKIPAAIELNALEELFNNIGRFSPAGLGQ